MLHLFAIHLDQLRHTLAAIWRERRHSDTGALTTLEVVVLAIGFVAIATLFVTTVGQAVTSRLDQLK